MASFTAEEKWKAAAREVKYRQRVYPRLVEAGKMSHGQSLQQIAVMLEISEDYAKLADKERLI